MIGSFKVPGYYVGDCRELLRQLPDDSIDCVVTSPPYWALRDYGLAALVWGEDPACQHAWGDPMHMHRGGPHGNGVMLQGGRSVVEAQAAVKHADAGTACACGAWRGQLGLEPSSEMFVEHLVEVFVEVRRVLKPRGTAWVNLGDSYAAGSATGAGHRDEGFNERWHGKAFSQNKHRKTQTQRPRRAGAGLRPKNLVGIPWRVAFALQAEGWWLRSDIIWAKPNPMPESVTDRPTKSHEYLFLLTKSEEYFYDAAAIEEPVAGTSHPRGAGINPKARLTAQPRTVDCRYQAPGQPEHVGLRRRGLQAKQNPSFSAAVTGLVSKRNKRSVWTIPTEPTPDAHFATFPRRLVEPCILAGCPAGGIVLDPFGGSGTVGRVAEDLGRKWLLFDLNPGYAKIAGRKTAQRSLLQRVNHDALGGL